MSVKNVTPEEFIVAFPAILAMCYSNMDVVIDDKLLRMRRFLDSNNPVFQFVKTAFFLDCNMDGEFRGCAVTIIDKRLPSEGRIGFIEFLDTTNGNSILSHATEYLVAQNVTTVRAPIDGSIWDRFRLCLGGENQPFLGEPYHPLGYEASFLAAGFIPIIESESEIETMTSDVMGRYASKASKVRESGIKIETLQATDFSDAVDQIVTMLNLSFSDFPSFIPLSREELFYNMLGGVGIYHSDIFVARKGTSIVGFILGYKDYYNPSPCRYVLKTIVVDSAYRSSGVGGALFCEALKKANEIGAVMILYAIMRKDNMPIQKIAAGEKVRYRKYALYERDLHSNSPDTQLL